MSETEKILGAIVYLWLREYQQKFNIENADDMGHHEFVSTDDRISRHLGDMIDEVLGDFCEGCFDGDCSTCTETRENKENAAVFLSSTWFGSQDECALCTAPTRRPETFVGERLCGECEAYQQGHENAYVLGEQDGRDKSTRELTDEIARLERLLDENGIPTVDIKIDYMVLKSPGAPKAISPVPLREDDLVLIFEEELDESKPMEDVEADLLKAGGNPEEIGERFEVLAEQLLSVNLSMKTRRHYE